ncbi:MAG TPA: DMT family transporter [Streptosporangiaceae bacterium]
MSPLIAVVAALGSSLAYAITAVTEQLGTHRVQSRRALSPELLLDLIKQPLWLAGVGANVASFALQVVALRFGPLALVEPILVCDLIFAGLISAILRKRADLVTGVGIVACAAGVVGFLVIARPSAGQQTIGPIQALALLAGFAAVLAGCLAVARWNRTARPLALALACGAAYAVTDFSIKLATAEFSGGLADLFTHWPIYAVVIIGPIGFVLNQNAFQAGTVLAPVLAVITITDTIGDIALGWLFLHEELASGPAAIAGQAASLLVMTVGIVVLAHRSPQAARQQDQTARPADPAASGPSSSGS